jgi:hypothetical protein
MISQALCRSNETLPYLYLACGLMPADAVIDEVCDYQDGNECADHRPPPVKLPLYIDTRVTSQVRIGVVALEIVLASIDVSIISIIPVVM